MSAFWLMGCDASAPAAGGPDLAAGLEAAPDATVAFLAGIVVPRFSRRGCAACVSLQSGTSVLLKDLRQQSTSYSKGRNKLTFFSRRGDRQAKMRDPEHLFLLPAGAGAMFDSKRLRRLHNLYILKEIRRAGGSWQTC
ncbi:MAG TPA: hypothetical protein VFU95_13235 [Telluria sp.]|nr:hypothetical protein [Telluria sp.]